MKQEHTSEYNPPNTTKAEPAKTDRNIIMTTNNVITKIMTLKKQNKMISAIADATSIDSKNDNEPTLVLYSVDVTILYLLLFVVIET